MRPSRPLDIARLRRAVTANWRLMAPFRDKRRQQIKQLLGRNFSDDGFRESIPMNLIALAYSVHVHNLVANRPRVLVTTKIRELQPTATDFQVSVDLLMKEIEIVQSLRRCAAAGLFGLTFAKMAICDDGSQDPQKVAGQPFLEDIDLDDLVVDMQKRWSQVAFIGNLYGIAEDELRGNDLYIQSVVDKLRPQPDESRLNVDGSEHISTLSVGSGIDEEPYTRTIDVIDVWIPRDKLLITLPRADINEALRVVEWDGPEHGPYHKLAFLEAPGQLMPLTPAAQWYDQHVLANALYRKVARQALRQKTVLGAVAEGLDDADRILKADDGDILKLRVQGGAQEYSFGGPQQAVLAMSVMAKDLFAYFAGNLDSYGGLSPQADTLGQDQLIHETASRQLKAMQDRMVEFTEQIVRDLAYYRWHDPIRTDNVTKRIEGVDFDFQSQFGPASKLGMFFNYQFEVVPYSMQHRTPAMRLQTMLQMLEKVIMPTTPLMQQQGLGLDVREMIRTIANYSDMYELNNWLRYSPESGGGHLADEEREPLPSILSGNRDRTVTRINRPDRTRRAADYALTQTLLGGGVQDSEAMAATGFRS